MKRYFNYLLLLAGLVILGAGPIRVATDRDALGYMTKYHTTDEAGITTAVNWSANSATLAPHDTDLVAVWKFSQSALTTDSKGSNTWTNDGVDENSGGKSDYCGLWVVANTDDMYQTPGADLKPTDKVALGFWIYLNSAPSSGNRFQILQCGGGGGSDSSVILQYYNNSGTLQLRYLLYEDDGTEANVTHNVTLTLSTWYHIGLTADGTNMKAYLNGSQVGSSQAYDGTIESTNVNNFIFGSRRTSTDRYTDARMDEFYFWKSPTIADTDAFMSALYNSATGAFWSP